MANSGRKEIGERLKQTAVEAGFTSGSIAERLGNTDGAVRGWWNGRNQIPIEMLKEYSRLVGRSLAYLITGEEEGDPEAVLVAWAKLLMSGHEPGAALDRVRSGGAKLTRQERDLLAAQAALLRGDLTTAAGADWERLTDSQRRQILRQIAEMVRSSEVPPFEG